MPLHLIKLAVGCDSVKELKGWVAERMATAKKKGLPLRHVHITRMTPKREEELLAGGSLYWVIRGEIAAREKIIAIEPFRDKDGIGRCRLVMQPKVIAVSPRPMRPFQGWRYFDKDVPPDLSVAEPGTESLIRAGAAGTGTRIMRYFAGDGIERPLQFTCTVGAGPAPGVTVENCEGHGTTFQNSYMVQGGQIAVSRQWIGPALGYVTIQTLRP